LWPSQIRPFSAKDVVSLRGTLSQSYPSDLMAKKAYAMFREMQKTGACSHTYGALDTVQVVQMAKYLSTIYVSGWQSSSTASSSNEPGPDLADYPSNTVPLKVEQLFKAQQFHDRKQREVRVPRRTRLVLPCFTAELVLESARTWTAWAGRYKKYSWVCRCACA
jgi:isocitrate lyase